MQAFVCMQISETLCPRVNPVEAKLFVSPCLSSQSISTSQAQAEKGTAASEVITRGRNSWELHPFTLGPSNRYGRPGDHGDEGPTGQAQLVRAVLRGREDDGGQHS